MSDLLVGSIIYASLTLLTLMLVLLNRRMTYWRRRGISHQSPNLIFGNLLGKHGKRSLRNILLQTYDEFKQTGESFCGFYWLVEPAVFVLNTKLALQILRDVQYFSKNTSVNGGSSTQFEELEEKIHQAVLKSQKVFKETLGDSDEKNVNIHLICKRYMEEVLDKIFPGKREGKASLIKRNYTQKWNYVFQQFNYKTQYCSGSLEAYAMDGDICVTLLCCILYELASDISSQDKIYKDIELKLLGLGNKFTHKCLEKQVSAALQRYSPFSHVTLRANKDYTTDQAGYTIEQGNRIIIPLAALTQNNQDYNECVQSNQLIAAAFGTVGMSLIYTALVLILRDYEFNVCTDTPQKLTLQETLPHCTLETALYLKIKKR